MTKENSLTSALATTSAMLAETLIEKEQYQDWWIKKNTECDALKSENIKLKRDLEFASAELKTAKAALQVRADLTAAAEADESPFTSDE